MKPTAFTIRLLQRALNALGPRAGLRRLKIDGRPGRRTRAALVRFLAGRGPEGEAALIRAIAALH